MLGNITEMVTCHDDMMSNELYIILLALVVWFIVNCLIKPDQMVLLYEYLQTFYLNICN